MHLVVGLGNPGPEHAGQRHNVGFMVLERLVERLGATTFRAKFDGRFTKVRHAGEDLVLLAPMTFMNRSGRSVQQAMRFFRVPLEDVLVVHDELDLPFGALRIKVGGGTAGHNGLKSVVQHAGGPGFVRVRVGIGRPPHGGVHAHVLSDFVQHEQEELDAVLDGAAERVLAVVADGPEAAQRAFPRKG